MKYQKRMLILRTPPHCLEWAAGILIAEKIDTWEEVKVRGQFEIRAAIPSGRSGPSLLKSFAQREKKIGCKIFLKKNITTLKDTTWQTKYLEGLRPFKLPNFNKRSRLNFPEITIDPSGKAKTSNHRLSLVAGMAFGTGTHLSTQLAAWCLALALENTKRHSVLDVGTGSGILAMVAKLYLAGKVIAVENDPEALQVARMNFKKNRMNSIIGNTSIDKVLGKYHVVVANILAPTLMDLKSKLLQHTKIGGQIILSGLTYRDIPDILNCYGDCRILSRHNRNGWSALRLQKTKA